MGLPAARGIQDATSAIAASSNGSPAKLAASEGPDLKKKTRQQPRDRQSRGEADHDAQGVIRKPCPTTRRRMSSRFRAERHPDPDLARALTDRVRNHSIQTHRRQGQRDHANSARSSIENVVAPEKWRSDRPWFEPSMGMSASTAATRSAARKRHAQGRPRYATPRSWKARILPGGTYTSGRAGGPQFIVPNAADHPDDLQRRCIAAVHQPLSESAFLRKQAPRERLIHQHHALRFAGILSANKRPCNSGIPMVRKYRPPLPVIASSF